MKAGFSYPSLENPFNFAPPSCPRWSKRAPFQLQCVTCYLWAMLHDEDAIALRLCKSLSSFDWVIKSDTQ